MGGSGVEGSDEVSSIGKGTDMPTRQTAPIGAPCWVDLTTSDPERSRAFYTQLFGWTAEEPAEEFGGYFNFSKDGVLVAGGMASQPDSGTPDVWSVYLATDDAQKTLEVATANGGHVEVVRSTSSASRCPTACRSGRTAGPPPAPSAG